MAIYVRTELPIAPYQQPTKHGTDDGGGGLWLNVFFRFFFEFRTTAQHTLQPASLYNSFL